MQTEPSVCLCDVLPVCYTHMQLQCHGELKLRRSQHVRNRLHADH